MPRPCIPDGKKVSEMLVTEDSTANSLENAGVPMLLQDLSTLLQKEVFVAAMRHQDLTSRMLEQHEACTRKLAKINQDLSSLSSLVSSIQDVPKTRPLALSAPDATKPVPVATTPTGHAKAPTRKPSSASVNSADESRKDTNPGDDIVIDGAPSDPASAIVTAPSKNSLTRDSQLHKLMKSSSSHLMSHAENLTREFSWKALRAFLAYITGHRRFESCATVVIMANAIVLCFEVQYNGLQIGYDLEYKGYDAEADVIWPIASDAFRVFDWLFGAIFAFEAVLKLASFLHKYFCDPWNWLDGGIVCLFFIEKVASQFMPFDAKGLRLFRFARLMRLVRIIRTIEECHQLYIMTTAIRGMCMVVLWAILLLSIILMTESLFLTQMLQAFYFKTSFLSGDLSEADLVSRRNLFEYFGSFTRCFLSMFELTLANWPPVTRLLQEQASEWFMPLCLIHKLTVGLAVVGVISGVIMQETFKVASTDDWIMMRQKSRQVQVIQEKMRELFLSLDQDSDGQMTWAEFSVLAELPAIKAWLASMEFDVHDLKTLFKLIDHDDSGAISLEELVERLPLIRGPARSLDLLALKKHLHCDTL